MECVYWAVRTGYLYIIPVMCFVWIWEQTAIISLYNINWLVFITDGVCLLCGTDWMFIYIFQGNANPQTSSDTLGRCRQHNLLTSAHWRSSHGLATWRGYILSLTPSGATPQKWVLWRHTQIKTYPNHGNAITMATDHSLINQAYYT